MDSSREGASLGSRIPLPAQPSRGTGEDSSTSGKEAQEEGPTQCAPGNGEVPPPRMLL